MNFVKAFVLIACSQFLVFNGHAEGRWTSFTNSEWIISITAKNDYIWTATRGGIGRWHNPDMSYVKFTTNDGLKENDLMLHGGDSPLAVGDDGVIWCPGAKVKSVDGGQTWTYMYEPSEGAIFDDIQQLIVGKNGEVWVKTNNSIYRYKENRWESLSSIENAPTIPITSFESEENGTIWFIGNNEIYSYDGLNWTPYSGFQMVTQIGHATTGNDGDIWFTGYVSSVPLSQQQYLIHYKDGIWTNYNIPVQHYYNSYPLNLAMAKDGKVWCWDSYTEELVFDGESWEHFDESNGVPQGSREGLVFGNNNDVWLAIGGAGVYHYDGLSWTGYTQQDGLGSNTIYDIKKDSDGVIWIGTLHGLSRFDGTSWVTFKPPNEMGSISCYSVIINENEVWVGNGRDGGLSHYDGSIWKVYTVNDGLSDNNISALEFGLDGSVWAGTASGLSMFNGSSWETLKEGRIPCIAVANNGDVWIGTDGSGVSKFNGAEWTDYTTGLTGLRIQCISVNDQGKVWIGTENSGVYNYDGINWIHFTTTNGLATNGILSLATVSGGKVWAGTDNGLSYFDGQTWSSNVLMKGHGITSIVFKEDDNTLWLGTYDTGVVRYDGTTFLSSTTEDGLAINYVEDLTFKSGNEILWAATVRGLSYINVHDLPLRPVYVEENLIPVVYVKLANYPNPFNTSTTIEFILPSSTFTSLIVYNIVGQKVRELVSESLTAGTHSAVWDGRDSSGNVVSSGIYISQLKAGNYIKSRTMTLLK